MEEGRRFDRGRVQVGGMLLNRISEGLIVEPAVSRILQATEGVCVVRVIFGNIYM